MDTFGLAVLEFDDELAGPYVTANCGGADRYITDEEEG